MTREEEIKKRAKECFDEPIEQALFWKGAEWADQNPRKGLWDGDRAIAWLKENIGEYYMTNEFEEYFDSMYEDLKKAMED